MRKLIWKEWREQSWKLGFGCVVLGALAVIGLQARIVADETIMMCVCFLGLTLLPVLSSTGLIPAERAEGSLESLLSLPIAPWKILAVKTAMGVLLCAVPMLLAAGASVYMAGGREMTTAAIVDLYGRSALTALSLFIWMLALTAHLPSEARAGLVGLGILIFWMLATMGLSVGPVEDYAFQHESGIVQRTLLAASPLAFVYRFDTYSAGARPPTMAMAAGIQVLVGAALWACARFQFTAGEGRK
jgi:ABC-type transport system involved in multi-copper enzyme maturation permease subunit